MAHYLLLIVEPPWNPDSTSDAEWSDTARQHRAFGERVIELGCRVVESGAFDPRASELFGPDGRQTITGYYRLECPTRETAELLAQACPTGSSVQLESLME